MTVRTAILPFVPTPWAFGRAESYGPAPALRQDRAIAFAFGAGLDNTAIREGAGPAVRGVVYKMSAKCSD